ncbi:glycyl-radical enzyme activating protein [Vibrio hangzhouensis]|uniref:glycyl-radical enzyme activating protein n=1 Tax=Vibrio hangzhouensis TaxID=462991 RepID=UPI001C96CC78|nr:glycyl-radical enzyme activating protein [Vibrio hangzhouensis]MBY6195593.1 glycyl-radical enzyme activating protein [Vibrio hangzhouensis]
MYFNIQRFSTHDGDGIRSILFLKGCSLACSWCQNPESRSAKHSLLFDQRSCMTECHLCVDACNAIRRVSGTITINRKQLDQNQIIALRDVCPTQALTVCGEQAKEDALFDILIKDKPFYEQSNGGITFSGGEPLLQSNLVASLASRLKDEGVSTAVETCMHVPWKNIEQVSPYIDCWLTDLKHTNEDKFYQWAEGSLKRIKANFQKLDRIANRIVIRVPVVPGFNDTEQELKEIIDFAAELQHCHELHLLPYHTLGINKYRLLDMPYLCSEQPLNNAELLNKAQRHAQQYSHINVTVRG